MKEIEFDVDGCKTLLDMKFGISAKSIFVISGGRCETIRKQDSFSFLSPVYLSAPITVSTLGGDEIDTQRFFVNDDKQIAF